MPAETHEEAEEQPNLASKYEDDDLDEVPKLSGGRFDDDEEHEEQPFGMPLNKVSKKSQEFEEAVLEKKQSWKLPDKVPG